MPFFLKNCMKLRKRKNRKKPKIKDAVNPIRDITDEVAAEEIWPDCRQSAGTVIGSGNNELEARVCNESNTDVTSGDNLAPAAEHAKAITQTSSVAIQEGDEIVEVDKKSKEGPLQIKNVDCAYIDSDGGVDILEKAQHGDPETGEEEGCKCIPETSEKRGAVFPLRPGPIEVSADSPTAGGTTKEGVEIPDAPHKEKISENDSLLKGEGINADIVSRKPKLELPFELLVCSSVEKVNKGSLFGIVQENSEPSDEENESTQLALKEMSKIIAGVNVTSNVFAKSEELRRLQCIIDKKEVSQNTDQIKDAEISGRIIKKELSDITEEGSFNGNENLLNSSADEDIRIESNDDNNEVFEGTEEFHNESKFLTCDKPSKLHITTEIEESNLPFSGDNSFKILTEKEIKPSECESRAGGNTNYHFITPENSVVENIGDKNEETILYSKSDKSSCSLDTFGVGENMASNTTGFSNDLEEKLKIILRQSCTGDMNHEIPLEHELSGEDLEIHFGENFLKTGIVTMETGTSDYFSKTDIVGAKDLFSKADVVETNDSFPETVIVGTTDSFLKIDIVEMSDSFSKTDIVGTSDCFTKPDIVETTDSFLRTDIVGTTDPFVRTDMVENSDYFSKTDTVETSDSSGKKGHNDETKLSESLCQEDAVNNDMLEAKSGIKDFTEDNETSVNEFQTSKITNKCGSNEFILNGEAKMNDSWAHIDDETKRSDVKNNLEGDFLDLDSNILGNEIKNLVSRNFDCNKEDHASGDFCEDKTVDETCGEIRNKSSKTNANGIIVGKDIEKIETDASMKNNYSDSLDLIVLLSQITKKNIVNYVEKISDESKGFFCSDSCNELNTVNDETPEKNEIGDSKLFENEISIKEWANFSDSRNNLHYKSSEEDYMSFTQNYNESFLEDLFWKRGLDVNTNSNSRSDTIFDIQKDISSNYFNFTEPLLSDTSGSFVIQEDSNVGEHSSDNLFLESPISNFDTNDNACEDSTDINFQGDIQYNEKSKLIENLQSKKCTENLKKSCFPVNIHRSKNMRKKKYVSKENNLNTLLPTAELDKNTNRNSIESLHEISSQVSELNQRQNEIKAKEEFRQPDLKMCDENICILSKHGLSDENLNSKNNSVFWETCFDSNPTLDTKTSKNFSLESLTFESSSPNLLLASGDEITEHKPLSENAAMFASRDARDKERTVQNSVPCKVAYLASEKKGETEPSVTNSHLASQNKAVITINILPRNSRKSKKTFSTRREDARSSAKNTPRHHRHRHDPEILHRNFTGGIPGNLLDEIEIRRREGLDVFNKMKEAALSDMKPTARVIPTMRSRSSGANSQSKRPLAFPFEEQHETSPRQLHGVERTLEGPTTPFELPRKCETEKGDGSPCQVLDSANLMHANTRRHSNESLHDISSQASERMTPVRKRVLDVSREIRSRKYPVRIDGKTYVINARNHKNPHNLKPPESELVELPPRDSKKDLQKSKKSSKHHPVKGQFKIYSPEKIECLPSPRLERQKQPDGRKLAQDYLKAKFDYAFGRYAGRGRLDNDSISYKRSREWLRDAGIVGKILTDDEVNDAFKCTSGMKMTMNKGDYRQYIKKLARLKKLNYDELYEKLCSVVAKQSYAAKQIM